MNFEQRKKINRGYRKLIVWQGSIGFYELTCFHSSIFPCFHPSVSLKQQQPS